MIIDKINDLLDLKVLLSDRVSIFNNDKTYPITDVKFQAYSIHLIADSTADEEDYLSGKDIIDKIYDICKRYCSNMRSLNDIYLIINQGSIGYFNKVYGSKEILTIKSNGKDSLTYTTILYKMKPMDTYR